MRVSTFFAETDQICDYVPVISTISNLVDLFQKCVCKCLSEATLKNRYWTHIQQKDLLRCFILLIPILGNIYVVITDYQQYKKDKKLSDLSVDLNRSSQRMAASALSVIASRATGVEVPAEQLMPAETEDQQRLFAACSGDDLQSVEELLRKGVSSNFYHSGITPLVAACQHSRPEIVRRLLEAGAGANTPDRFGNTPFLASCVAGNLDSIQLLRPQVPNLNAANPQGITGLMFAAGRGHLNVVQFLVLQGADRMRATADGTDALACAIFSDHAHVLPALLTDEENVDARRYEQRIDWFRSIQHLTPLLYATLFARTQSAIYLIPRSDVLQADSQWSTALFYSVKHVSVLRPLLTKCSAPGFVNHRNLSGSTALHRAIELDQPDTALLLLQNGADPFLPGGFKELIIAQLDAVNGRPLPDELLRMVAEYYVSKEEDVEGKTPLVLACEKGMDGVVGYIRGNHGHRINAEVEEQIRAASQVAIARRGQPQPVEPERPNLLAAGLDLMASGLKAMQPFAEMRARQAEEIQTLGPIPRTGMELVLGRLATPW